MSGDRNGKIMRRAAATLLAFGLFLGAMAASASGRRALEPFVEVELERLEETYALLDTYASEIWPGWDDYLAVEFQVQFPNLLFLLVGPRDKVPEGYEPVAERTVRGKQVYINRREELPIKLTPPLIGGGGGGMVIRIRLDQVSLPPAASKDAASSGAVPQAQSEGQILLYVHEFFHGFQSEAWKRPEGKKEDRNFPVTPEYAAYSEVEGTALMAAWKARDKGRAVEAIRDYLVARELKHGFMPPEAVRYEVLTAVSEGTATYSDTKMAALIRDRQYRTKVSHVADPYFYGFRYAGDYVLDKIDRQIEYVKSSTLDTLVKYYCYGALQCHLLDRYAPDWKKGFFASGKDLDEVMAGFFPVSGAEKTAIAAGFGKKYAFNAILAKHAAVVKERNDAIALAASRKGKKYIVNIKATKEFYMLMPRGKSVRMGVEQILLQGTQDFRLGEIEITTADTLLHQTGLWDLVWIDTEASPGDKGYTFEYSEMAGDVYKGLVFKTKGFTLKAPEAKIEESADEVRIVVLTKASRDGTK
jgi:hypothetical protein